MFGPFLYAPKNPDDVEILPMIEAAPPVPEEELDEIVFCNECACNYFNGCPSHKTSEEKQSITND